MISRIIIPLDGSLLAEQVLPYVKILGQSTEARIVLVRVVEPAPPDLAAVAEEGLLAPSVERRWQQAHAYLEALAEKLRWEGLVAATEVLEGEPASSIVSVAEQRPGTLVAMCTHGRSGLGRWVLGSVTDKVLHATTNPLLIARARTPEGTPPEVKITSLVVPLDGSALAEQVLPLAADLARKLGVQLALLQATPTIGDYYQYAEGPPPDIMEDLARDADEAAAAYLDSTANRLRLEGVPEVEPVLVHGPPALAITDYVHENPHCLVAITTHGRSGIGRWVVGSVADRVIRGSGAPVLVVRGQE